MSTAVLVGEPGGAEKGESKAVPLPRNNLAQGLDTQTTTHTHAGMHTHTHTQSFMHSYYCSPPFPQAADKAVHSG